MTWRIYDLIHFWLRSKGLFKDTSVSANPIVALKERGECTCRCQDSGCSTTSKLYSIPTLISSSISCNCFSYSCFFASSVSWNTNKSQLLPLWVACSVYHVCETTSSSPWNWATQSSLFHLTYRFVWFMIFHILFAVLTYEYLRISSIMKENDHIQFLQTLLQILSLFIIRLRLCQ